jgi:magnesium-transporting ATPase (P-type)
MTLMMFNGTFLTDGECIMIDLFVSLPLCSLLPLIPSHDKLTYHKPYSKLASFPIFISLFIQIVINLIFQIGGLFSLNYFFPKSNIKYEKYRICSKGPKTDEDNCIENSVLFLISYPQFLFVGLVLITAAPFKKNIYSNIILLIYIILIFIYCFYIIFHGDYLTKKWLLLREFPDDNFRKDDYVAPIYYISFKYYLMGYVFINFLICLFFEKKISNFIIKKWLVNKMKEKQMKIEREEIKPNLNLLNEIRNYTKVNK